MKTALVALTVITLVNLYGIAGADVFNMGLGLTNLETVIVDDAGNEGELSGGGAGGYGPDRICGAVAYDYRIGKYEVTAAQYCDFLNRKAKSDSYGLYNTYMGDTSIYYRGCNIQRGGSVGNYNYSIANDWANRPVNYVSFWDACRFANWLHNGQGDGDTETGAYKLSGYNGNYGNTIRRNINAKWYLASEDEWYKAAYYKGGSKDAGYWDYPTQSDTAPSNQVVDPDAGNNANCYKQGLTLGSPYYRTPVGEFENSPSAYGTFDQGGNLFEKNETPVYATGAFRGLRGGSFYHPANYMSASVRFFNPSDVLLPLFEDSRIGFRLAAPIPEPSSIIALLGFLGTLSLAKRRRA